MGEGLSHTCFQGLEKLCLGAAVLPGHLSPCFKRVGTAEPGCLKVKPLKKSDQNSWTGHPSNTA